MAGEPRPDEELNDDGVSPGPPQLTPVAAAASAAQPSGSKLENTEAVDDSISLTLEDEENFEDGWGNTAAAAAVNLHLRTDKGKASGTGPPTSQRETAPRAAGGA